MNKKKLSIIVPIFNEEQTLPVLFTELLKVFTALPDFERELILINDGSRDRSLQIIQELCAKNIWVKGISFSRHFGHQKALTAGYEYASGDAIVIMDAGMLDPASLLLKFVERWQDGAAVVYARCANHSDSWVKKTISSAYGKLLDSICDTIIPRNVSGFCLLDARVVAILKTCPEQARDIYGLIAWTGFESSTVDFERTHHCAGFRGATWKKRFSRDMKSMISFSLVPLRIAGILGMLILMVGLFLSCWYFCKALFFLRMRINYLLIPLVISAGGGQLLLLWIISEYIGRMSEHQKDRPKFIIADTINF